jgi:tetratricopeptide (TPR) repeat protein
VAVGQPDRAVESYSDAIKLDPLSSLIYRSRAEAHEILGEYSLAVDDYETILRSNPENSNILNRKAVALFSLGRLEEAIRDFGDAIDVYDKKVERLIKKANLDEAAKLDPFLARTYNNRGSAFYGLGRIERSIEDYDLAIQLSPRSSEFYVNRASAYEILRKNAAARRDFERAIELGFDAAALGRN